jgi:tRNA A-37 threonylcarbamoyl transferase component Bud32
MELEELALSGRTPALPLALVLNGENLEVLKLLRVLPGQRYVGLANWRGRKVLAKLLVGPKAPRAFRRELDGSRMLASQGLPTPALLAEGLQSGKGGWLLFDFLEASESLEDVWLGLAKTIPPSETLNNLLQEALALISRLHSHGLWQDDLHLGNLLRCDGRLYVIDAGSMRAEVPGQLLSRKKVLENLAVFFAQLPSELDEYIENFLVHYLQGNSEYSLPLDVLVEEMAKVRRWRLHSYLKKIGRDCSLFSARINAFCLQVVRRESAGLLQSVLENPDALMAKGMPLKQGGSATVIRLQLDERNLLIKRYNLKGVLHWLRRCWRPSRAWHSWREANRLQHLGIATPLPLAVLENRCCWLRGRAWLVTEYCGGQDILTLFKPWVDSAPPEHLLLAVERLFASLRRERISHGDLKGTNLLWDESLGCWSLIDLDAMQQHVSQRRFNVAYARDRARFLRNWPAESALHHLLDTRIPRRV